MSRMKIGALRAAHLGASVIRRSGAALLAMGAIDAALFAAMARGVSAGHGNRRRARSRYMPHQGPAECARRLGMSREEWIARFQTNPAPKPKRTRKPKVVVFDGNTSQEVAHG